jgi:hypothetical protein
MLFLAKVSLTNITSFTYTRLQQFKLPFNTNISLRSWFYEKSLQKTG